jgi:2-amino-4-hydroxy-6-hydroxymethyldihydropteridine diphosphokinase
MMPARTHIAFIGLGSDLGDRLANLARALATIGELENTEIIAVSQTYETEPAGAASADHPRYANAVVRVRTGMEADLLMTALLEIEEDLGRPAASDRAGEAPAPRSIDLDMLLYDEEEWHAETLVLPHPRMKGRAFVMRPLVEVGPDARWPDGSSITPDQVQAATEGPIVRALGPIPAFEGLTVSPGSAAATPGSGPDAPEDWVEFAMLSRFRPERKPDLDLMFAEMVLGENGIPFRWDPHSPTEGCNPWGVGSTIRLLVPAGYAERAHRVVLDAERATPEWPTEYDDADAAGTDTEDEE